MNSKMHWPSMFMKSKSSTSSRNQLPQAANSPAMRVPCSALAGKSSHNYELEMDMSQPKARSRWNPKPEQVEILEAIFSSGMVSPPREEIKRIRAQLEVFGQVGDVNVFYWFQNRKTRTKRRPRLPAVQRSKYGTKTGAPSSTSPPSSSTTSVRSKTITDLSNSSPNSMHNSIRDQYCFSSAVPVSSFAGHQYDPQAVCEEMSKTSTSVQSETITDLSNCIPNCMHSNIGEQYCFPSAVPVSSFAGHQYDQQAVCEEMSKTSTSVQSETITDLSNCIPNSMHSNIGEQYSFPSAVPASSFAGHQYDQQAVCEEMSKTSTSVQSETITDLSNCIPNSMHSNIGDQYYFTSIVPVSSFARHQYDPQAVYEEMSKKTTSVQSETIMDLSNGPPSSMHSNIGEQYCFPSAVPVSSFAGSQYDLQAVCEEMSKTSTSSQSGTITDLSNCSPNSMHSNIGDQYYFSAAVPVSSSAGQDYDLETVYKEMSNYNEFNNMQAIRAAAGGGQSILNEGTGGVLEESIINSNPLITVIINEIPTVIPSGPINFRDFFGDTILLHSSGESVLVNELGFIVLEHGAMYFSI